jgi:hypothetical protein
MQFLTALYFSNTNGVNAFNIGAEGGYFMCTNLEF